MGANERFDVLHYRQARQTDKPSRRLRRSPVDSIHWAEDVTTTFIHHLNLHAIVPNSID
jgi:hypothetical protein